jgi:L-gulonate 3-dehydrogenase
VSEVSSLSPIQISVAIIGAGTIGIAFAVVFARAGIDVKLFDPDNGALNRAPARIMSRASSLAKFGLIDDNAEALVAKVALCDSLEGAVYDASMVIECALEKVDVKKAIFTQLSRLAHSDAVLVSSSSAIPVSAFASDLECRSRCLVAHPANPPYLIPIIEVVPASFTDENSTRKAEEIFVTAGLKPIRVKKEIEGFVFNRLQGAILREAYCLVRDGIATVDDIDTVVREGLGFRWSVVGPFETSELNYNGGIVEHASRMSASYARMGAERGQADPWTPELVAEVDKQRRRLLSLDDWEERVTWRDHQLMQLTAERKNRVSKG